MPDRKASSKTKGKRRIKRTKTYSGCWTCRERGVKCDERRPTCSRCARGPYSCAGYNVRLVWEDDEQVLRGKAKRRVLFDGSEEFLHVLSQDEIDSALDLLDKAQSGQEISLGSFAVFTLQCPTPQTADGCSDELLHPERPLDSVVSVSQMSPSALDWNSDQEQAHWDLDLASFSDKSVSASPITDMEETPGSVDVDDEAPILARTPDSFPTRQNLVQTIPLSALSIKEPQLMGYWVSHLSNIMFPVPLLNNPFRSIYLPMLLSLSDSDSFGNAALLHSIYAVSAFHGVRASSLSEQFSTGTHHHRLSLKYLRLSLKENQELQGEAILGAILTLVAISIITGENSNWRLHLQGARNWLSSQDSTIWNQTQRASWVYQFFLFSDSLASTTRHAGSDADIQSYSPASWYDAEPDFGLTTPFALHNFFGITAPLLQAVSRINHMAANRCSQTEHDIHTLERDILCASPMSHAFQSSIDTCADILRNYAGVFYYAIQIHFYRAIRRLTPHTLQPLVQASLSHIESIEKLETQLNKSQPGIDQTVSGSLWPVFITACEVEGEENRLRILRWFHKGNEMRIGNIGAAERVVREVWRRRDSQERNSDVRWHDVMEDLGLDVLLL